MTQDCGTFPAFARSPLIGRWWTTPFAVEGYYVIVLYLNYQWTLCHCSLDRQYNQYSYKFLCQGNAYSGWVTLVKSPISQQLPSGIRPECEVLLHSGIIHQPFYSQQPRSTGYRSGNFNSAPRLIRAQALIKGPNLTLTMLSEWHGHNWPALGPAGAGHGAPRKPNPPGPQRRQGFYNFGEHASHCRLPNTKKVLSLNLSRSMLATIILKLSNGGPCEQCNSFKQNISSLGAAASGRKAVGRKTAGRAIVLWTWHPSKNHHQLELGPLISVPRPALRTTE